MERLFFMIGAGLMFLGVAAGAFGAHGLAAYFGQYPDLKGTYETAVQYHLTHALALFISAWAVDKWGGNFANWSGYFFILGILLFSGSLYLLVAMRLRWLGAITPLGGIAFLLGWLCLFVAAWRGQ
jgi:uncharacterized membrane protein YgdD (TMEM256/DUF423 family)